MAFRIFPKRISLRVKATIPFIGIAILPLMSVMLITINNLQASQYENAVAISKVTAQKTAQEVQSFIQLQFEALNGISAIHPEFSDNPDVRDILLERFLHRSGAFMDISLVDAQGRELARKNLIEVITSDDLISRANNAEFQVTVQHGSYIGPLVLSKGKPSFVLAKEIRDIQGKLQGVVIAQVDARILQDVVQSPLSNSQQIRSYIVNEDGLVIGHPDISQVLAQRDFTFIPTVRQLILQKSLIERTQTYINDLGQEVLGVGIPLNNKAQTTFAQEQWFVIVEEPAAIVLSPVRQITRFSIAILGIMLVVAVAGALLFAYTLTQPIHQLQQGVKQIGLGNLDFNLHIRSNDELGDLASEFNKMRLRLKEIRLREENLSKLKSEFVSIVAHQLRTPLSALKWAISLFLEAQHELPKDQKELVRKMETSNQRMINLVNDLLDAARIEEGRFVYKRTPTAIEEIIQSILIATKEKSTKKNVHILYKESKEPLPSLSIDREAIEMALQNLIENAINYTKPEGKVEISATRTGANALLVSIEDSGIGIDPKNKERMFTKFFRGANALRMETEGSGLGLFIVKNVIEAHGGKIWFESQIDKGTNFHFTLPFD